MKFRLSTTVGINLSKMYVSQAHSGSSLQKLQMQFLKKKLNNE